MPIALIAHGGAGKWRPGSEQDAIAGMKAAVEKGRGILLAGGSALDAVCASVVVLEDNPIFNAGTGAVLNFDGYCELAACIMESRECARGGGGGVAAALPQPVTRRAQGNGGDRPRDACGRGRAALRARDGISRLGPGHARGKPLAGQAQAHRRSVGKHSLRMRRFLKSIPSIGGRHRRGGGGRPERRARPATSTGGVTMKLVGRGGRLAASRRGQLRLDSRRRLGHGKGRVRDALSPLLARARSGGGRGGATLPRRCRKSSTGSGRDYDAEWRGRGRQFRDALRECHRKRDMPHAFFARLAVALRCARRALAAPYKIPVSTMVVIYTPSRGAALERAGPPRIGSRVTAASTRASVARHGHPRGGREKESTPPATSSRNGTCRTCSKSIRCGHRFGTGSRTIPARVRPRGSGSLAGEGRAAGTSRGGCGCRATRQPTESLLSNERPC